jgi:hypothetical protein
MTETELSAATTRTKRIRTSAFVLNGNGFHNIGGGMALLQQLHHHIKRWADMHEKLFKAGAQIIMPFFTIFG